MLGVVQLAPDAVMPSLGVPVVIGTPPVWLANQRMFAVDGLAVAESATAPVPQPSPPVTEAIDGTGCTSTCTALLETVGQTSFKRKTCKRYQ